jgi:hypothetical protein
LAKKAYSAIEFSGLKPENSEQFFQATKKAGFSTGLFTFAPD